LPPVTLWVYAGGSLVVTTDDRRSVSYVYGYVRLSRGEADSLGLEAQRRAILAQYPDAEVVEELGSARRADDRAELVELRRRLRRGDTLVVARLDRLTRSIADFGTLLEEAQRRGWNLVLLDQALNTATANGRLVANILASVAQWEREMISERTRAVWAVKRSEIPELVERDRRVLALRKRGLTQRAIASKLGLHKEQVARVLRRVAA
jgi:DNA invertase Pin-like site-specific DNA recombinase